MGYNNKWTTGIQRKGVLPAVRLHFDPALCMGCHFCELACSAVKHGVFSPSRARISVTSEYRIDGNLETEARYCDGCHKCVDACPSEALHLEDGYLVVDKDLCTQCDICVEECPHGIIKDLGDYGIAVCDSCHGDPRCVKWCAVGALTYGEKAVLEKGGSMVG